MSPAFPTDREGAPAAPAQGHDVQIVADEDIDGVGLRPPHRAAVELEERPEVPEGPAHLGRANGDAFNGNPFDGITDRMAGLPVAGQHRHVVTRSLQGLGLGRHARVSALPGKIALAEEPNDARAHVVYCLPTRGGL